MKSLDLGEFKRWWLQRPAREKLMLGACSLGVVLALGDSLAITPVEKRLRQARGAEEQLQARWDQLQLRRQGRTVQDQELREQENSLRQRLQAAQARVGTLNLQMADTAQLPNVLRDVMATMGSTKLLELSFADEGASATSARGAASGASATGAASAAPRRVYQLPVTLKVSGSWAELTSLLNQVEKRAPALQWQTLSLDGNDWPAIQLTLRAHVRSLQPRWGSAP